MLLKPIIPFEPVVAEELTKDENWIAQIKWDGVRILSYFDGNQMNLVNRKLNNRTLQYPEFLVPDRFCRASSFILDGEMIAFNDKIPSFQEIMKRDSLRSKKTIAIGMNQTKVTYMIFDVLFYNGEWVVDKMLHERQKILESIVIPQNDVQFVQNFADPEALYKLMEQYQMEGIIYKNLMSTYLINGKDRRWQKRKVYHDLFAAVGGFTLRGNIVNSLLLGLLDENNQFFYIGHAGTGKLTVQDWREITQTLEPLITDTKRFMNTPERSKDAVWVVPQMTVKVQFLEWTFGGTMRQPSIQAIVDVPLSQCTAGQIKG